MSARVNQRVDMQFEDADQQREAVSLGMWTFLATEVLFFGGAFLGYAAMRAMNSAGFEAASGHLDIKLGTLNTAVLLVSSLFMALAERALVHRTDRRKTLIFLGSVIFFALLFICVKGFEYHHEWAEGRVPILQWRGEGPHEDASKLFFFLYFSMSGLHAAHMIIGIAVIAGLLVKIRNGSVGPERTLPLEMTALYWHFVDIVWIFLFPLLYLIGAGGSS